MKSIPFLAVVFLLSSVLTVRADWPVYRGNVQADACAAVTLSQELKTVWRYRLEKGWFQATAVMDDETVYVGSPESANQLRALLAWHQKRLTALPPNVQKILRNRSEVVASLPAEPKKMLEALALYSGLKWQNLDELPHDLWDDTKIAGSTGELLIFLLFGFDKTFDIDSAGMVLRVIPIPLLKMDTKAMPAVKPETLSPNPPPNVPLSRRRFTLKVEEQRLDELLEALAQRLGLELTLDKKSLESKGIALEQRVSFEVKNATAFELFRAFLQPLNLQFAIRNGKIEVE